MTDVPPESLGTCPRCGKKFTPYGGRWLPGMPPYPATSRRDNQTYICSDCGLFEALEDATGHKWVGEPYWCTDLNPPGT